ncbi:cytochrome P450 [Gloeothece citriformis PCC 7424]|uniref:Cytochrome P450 n=1 Tax=Gloeothece citriformis (strain PCC 7424) TaxID=65393 RepID=B7KKX3_GLOC7|nr:cytochrome P450 [Gloeothece citriformis]ACK71092.1 cytochrome P450 [Gloeothece citriformis PCC 7424]
MKEKSLPPGNLGLPIIGETISFLNDSDFASKRHQKYGSVFKTRIFGRPTIFVSGADAVRFVLTHENKYFASTWPKSTRTLLGPASLSVNTGEFHTSRRKIMFQAFQPRALASYIPTIERITDDYLAKWETMETFQWYPELRNYTFDIASSLFVGIENGSQTRLGELFEDWCAGLFSLPLPFPWTAFGKALRCRDGLLEEIETIIKQRQQQDNFGNDALGILLTATDEKGNKLSLEELKDQILLLLFAGHETLTSALASFCLFTVQYPQVSTEIKKEIERLQIGTSVTLEELKQMEYLEQVLKEVLRFVPPVGGGFREAVVDCELEGYLIPKGWIVQYQIRRTHRDTTVYNEPQQFDPSRFNNNRAEDKQKTFAYVPFGGGLRECLGKEFARLEMRIFASRLVKDYQWNLIPNQDLSMTATPTPHPRDGLKVNFHRLKSEVKVN